DIPALQENGRTWESPDPNPDAKIDPFYQLTRSSSTIPFLNSYPARGLGYPVFWPFTNCYYLNVSERYILTIIDWDDITKLDEPDLVGNVGFRLRDYMEDEPEIISLIDYGTYGNMRVELVVDWH
ncbi:MAG: hypothetical protein AAFW00_14205, partial [Bacteroidota bacterium]